jgi:hypothetical protein
MIVQSLAMSGHSYFDSFCPRLLARRARSCPDSLEENLVEGRLHKLESLDDRSCRDNAMQQVLRIRPVHQLDFEVAIGVVDPSHKSPVSENLSYSVG